MQLAAKSVRSFSLNTPPYCTLHLEGERSALMIIVAVLIAAFVGLLWGLELILGEELFAVFFLIVFIYLWLDNTPRDRFCVVTQNMKNIYDNAKTHIVILVHLSIGFSTLSMSFKLTLLLFFNIFVFLALALEPETFIEDSFTSSKEFQSWLAKQRRRIDKRRKNRWYRRLYR